MERFKNWFQKNTVLGFILGIFLGVLLVVGCFTIYETQFASSHEGEKNSGVVTDDSSSTPTPATSDPEQIVVPDSDSSSDLNSDSNDNGELLVHQFQVRRHQHRWLRIRKRIFEVNRI